VYTLSPLGYVLLAAIHFLRLVLPQLGFLQSLFPPGFDGGITDLQVVPDGYLYVLTFAGSIYRIVPIASA